MNRLLLRYLLPSLLMLAGVAGVAGVAGYLFYGRQSVVAPAQAAPFTLTILHINDHHSHLQESLGQLQLGNQRVEVAMGRNIGVCHQGVEQAVPGMVVARVEITVLAPARAGGGFGADGIEQRVVDQRDHE